MRTFIALNLSENTKNELARIQGELKKAEADVKWVAPSNVHLTLKFLGEIDEAQAEEIKKSLDGISAKNKPFEISLFKVGAFPGINSPRVVWVGIDRNCSETERIARETEEALEKLMFPKEERPFSAHLTIGRVKSGKNKNKLKELLLSVAAKPETCLIDRIILFQSTLTPKGPIYTALHEALFKAG